MWLGVYRYLTHRYRPLNGSAGQSHSESTENVDIFDIDIDEEIRYTTSLIRIDKDQNDRDGNPIA